MNLTEKINQLEQDRLTNKRVRSEQQKEQASAQAIAKMALEGALSTKATDLMVLYVREVSGVADYFVLCTGESPRQIKAIADAIKDTVRENCNEKPWRTEGYDAKEWVLIDYVDVVVHVFNEEKRAFYNLEKLWGDAPAERVENESIHLSMLIEN